MDDQIRRIVIVVFIVALISVGIVAAYVLKNYEMSATEAKTNLRLYYSVFMEDENVIFLKNFNWTAATGVIVSNGTVLDLWARNEGNQAANFTFQIMNQVNCTVLINPAALPNFMPGNVTAMNLTLDNVTENPSWEIKVEY